MADDDRWGGGASSWDRGYRTTAVLQGRDRHGDDDRSESEGRSYESNRIQVMNDDDDDDDDNGSSE